MAEKKRKDQEGNGWINIYADMVTLLLCFFILLYSFSVIDNQKFEDFLASFQGRGILDGGSIVIPGPNVDPIDPNDPDPNDDETPFWADSQRLYEYIGQYLSDRGIEASIELSKETRGVQMQMPDHLLFNPGNANITSQGVKLLELLFPLFEEIPNSVLVEGHTDNVPINTVAFPSNWELSAGRSAQVVRFYVEARELDPQRFFVIGYGEFHPIAPNSTDAGRAINRRVVLVIRSKEVGSD